jgi:hypothetical protein
MLLLLLLKFKPVSVGMPVLCVVSVQESTSTDNITTENPLSPIESTPSMLLVTLVFLCV